MTELQKLDPELVAYARQASGEGYGTTITYLNFNGRDGIYFKSTGKKDEETGKTIKETLGKTWEGGVILKTRNRVSVYKPNDGKEWKSDEFDSYDEQIVITDQYGNKIMQGSYKQCKSRDKDIRSEKVLYAYADDSIYKIAAKGGSLSRWITYMKTFDQTDTVMRYKTVFGAKQEESDYGSYWVMTFARGEQVDLAESVGLSKQLEGALGSRPEPVQGEVVPKAEPIPVVQLDEPPLEAYEDLPF